MIAHVSESLLQHVAALPMTASAVRGTLNLANLLKSEPELPSNAVILRLVAELEANCCREHTENPSDHDQ